MTEMTPGAAARVRFMKPEWARERPGAAYAGIVLAIAQVIFLCVARILGVIWSFQEDFEPLADTVRVLALALALGFVPAIVTILLGRSALTEAWGGRMRTGVLGAIALGSGCLFMVLGFSRLVDGAIAGSLGDDFGGFLFGSFWYA